MYAILLCINTCMQNLLGLKALKAKRKCFQYTFMAAYTILYHKFSSLDVQLFDEVFKSLPFTSDIFLKDFTFF